MTTTICDVCNASLEPNYRNRDTLKGEASLMTTDDARVGQVAIRNFTFEITVISFKFNTTNFHVCNKCLMDAVARSLPEKEAA